MSDEPTTVTEELRDIVLDADFHVRDAALREVDVRLLPWDTIIDTIGGPEAFARGAFDGAVPEDVFMFGPEHRIDGLGVGQDGRPTPVRIPVAVATRLGDDGIGPTATFRFARTAAGDEALGLLSDRIIRRVSVEFRTVAGGTRIETRAGRRTSIHTRARLVGATPTHRPAYGDLAEVLAVRTQHQEEPIVSETATAPEPQPAAPVAATIVQTSPPVWDDITLARAMSQAFSVPMQGIMDRLEAIEERGRASFSIPADGSSSAKHPADFHRGDWLSIVLRGLTGDVLPAGELQARAAADLITTDNLGVIPTAYLNEIIGIIDQSRPFLDSTRRVPLPRAGTTLSVPKIATRPTTAIQGTEKTELSSGATSIVPATFGMTSIGGYGDISIQLLKRSDPSYLQLYIDLLAEQYAIDADDKAVDVLLAASGVHSGGELDPEDLTLGTAWSNTAAVSRLLKLDRMWMSTSAVAAFIDAKNPTGNGPLYSTLAADITAGGGAGGSVSGLRPVHVPALDDEAVDIIVGPSRGFVWTEDGTYTLQVDNPAKAGRDVGLVGMVWLAPMYPTAFTTFTIPAS